MTLGAVNGGLLMRIGRRKALFICCILGIIGVSTTLIWNYKAIIVGRFIFGFSVGLISSVCPKYIEEVVPNKLFDRLAPSFNFS
jgi:MFS family permease